MSVVICVSYQTDKEISEILERLKDLNLRATQRNYHDGQYRRIYLRSRKHDREDIRRTGAHE